MTTEIAQHVGFIGFGDQGLPMARAIADAGFTLHAWARRPGSLDKLDGVTHVRHATLEDLAAASDVVGLCVNTDEDVLALITGGLAAAMRPGTAIVNHGTGTPAQAVRFAEACRQYRVEFLDAPVSGGRIGAEARTLATMVGGPEAAAQTCEPIFRSFSARISHLGGHGAGELAKLLNNTMMMMNLANIAEILDLADQFGADLPTLVDVVGGGSGSSAALQMVAAQSAGVPADVVAHLHDVLLLDMQLFDAAMQESHLPADAVSARGYAGANNTAHIVGLLQR